jgi:hypothetical protein
VTGPERPEAAAQNEHMAGTEPNRRLVDVGTSEDEETSPTAERDQDPHRVEQLEDQERRGWPDEPTTS